MVQGQVQGWPGSGRWLGYHEASHPRKPPRNLEICWVAVKDRKLGYCTKETFSFTIYPYCGNFI